MSEPIGVLHVVQSFSLGGAERMAVELVNRLSRDEFRPALLATRSDGPLRAEVRADVPARALERRRRWDPRCFAEFRRFVREHGIRIIHSHGPGPLQYVAAGLLPGSMGCIHVFHDHHGRTTAQEPDPDPAVRLAFQMRLSAVIGVSRLACEWASLRLGWPAPKTFLLRNGIDTSRFFQAQPAPVREEFGIGQDEILLGMVANLRWEKDHLTALRALSRCRSKDQLRLLLLGGPAAGGASYEREVREAVASLGLDERVLFAGSRPDVPEVLAACDAGMLSSCRESGPLALLEYLASGLPIVSTRIGEIGGELPDTGLGYLVPPGDPQALADALDALVQVGAEERRAMGARGRDLVAREYDQHHTARRLEQIYRKVTQW